MADIAAPPIAPDGPQSIIAAPAPISAEAVAAAATAAQAATAPAPEQPASETLYIQNLNEKIKIPGMSPFLLCSLNSS